MRDRKFEQGLAQIFAVAEERTFERKRQTPARKAKPQARGGQPKAAIKDTLYESSTRWKTTTRIRAGGIRELFARRA